MALRREPRNGCSGDRRFAAILPSGVNKAKVEPGTSGLEIRDSEGYGPAWSTAGGRIADDFGRADVPAHLPAFEGDGQGTGAPEQLAVRAREQLAQPAFVLAR